MATSTKSTQPRWWTGKYDSAWDRVKEAFRRDWEQTKHDFGGKQPDLSQNVDDTLAQAAGKRAIPSGRVPNYDEQERSFRFGYGARMHYSGKYSDWNDELEHELQEDWNEDWPTSREAVRRGWEFSRGRGEDIPSV